MSWPLKMAISSAFSSLTADEPELSRRRAGRWSARVTNVGRRAGACGGERRGGDADGGVELGEKPLMRIARAPPRLARWVWRSGALGGDDARRDGDLDLGTSGSD
jgi:hypothetical protein